MLPFLLVFFTLSFLNTSFGIFASVSASISSILWMCGWSDASCLFLENPNPRNPNVNSLYVIRKSNTVFCTHQHEIFVEYGFNLKVVLAGLAQSLYIRIQCLDVPLFQRWVLPTHGLIGALSAFLLECKVRCILAATFISVYKWNHCSHMSQVV